MAISTSVLPWTLSMPAGSLQQWLFTFTTVDPVSGQRIPFSIAGTTWEYVVRVNATDTGSPVFSINTSAGPNGQLIVTSTSSVSSVQLTMNPAATVNLAPSSYAHTLWMNPSTTTAYTWVTGSLNVVGNPQP